MKLSDSNMSSVVLAVVVTFIGQYIMPNADVLIKIIVPLVVGIVNHIVDLYFRKREKRKEERKINEF